MSWAILGPAARPGPPPPGGPRRPHSAGGGGRGLAASCKIAELSVALARLQPPSHAPSGELQFAALFYSQTAPLSADPTSLAYLARTPVV